MARLWEVIDSVRDSEAGVITESASGFRYDGDDVDLETLVNGLGEIAPSEIPDRIAIESKGKYVAIPEEDPEDDEISRLTESLANEVPVEDEPEESPVEEGWVAQVISEAGKPLGQIIGNQAGKLEFEIQDATFQGLLMLDVIPALEAVSMTPANTEYPEALKKTIESLKEKKYRVELREVLSLRESSFGGDQPTAVIRWGSVSPTWGGPAAPWAPVPLGIAHEFVKETPDAALEINFPTVFEEDRSAKVKDILAGSTSGFISQRRAAEQYAKEMGFEQFDYDEEQSIMSKEKPPPTLSPMLPGSSGGGNNNPKEVPTLPSSIPVDAPGQGVSRGEWSADNSQGQHSYKMDQRLAELEESVLIAEDSIKALKESEKATKARLKEAEKEVSRRKRELKEAKIERDARTVAFAEIAAKPSTIINIPERETKVEVHTPDIKPADVKVEVHPPAVEVHPPNIEVNVIPPAKNEREVKYDPDGRIVKIIDQPQKKD